MYIFLENLNKKVSTNANSALELYNELKSQLPIGIISLTVNGHTADWFKPIEADAKINFLSFNDDKGKEVYWHSSAHLMAQAILRHYPDAKPTIGPPIDQGFYYDFANLTFSEHEFAKIEAEMNSIIKENYSIERLDYKDISEAKAKFKDNPFKLELIDEFKQNLSAYKQGEFTDLCRGPHLQNTGLIGAVKILKTSASYWRANKDNASLTRVYAISFPSQKELNEYLAIQKEAQRRDHRLIGANLDLFSFRAEAPGIPFIHNNGLIIFQELIKFWKELHIEFGYQEIKTPGMLKRELWEISGHWQNYKENMYTTTIDDEDYAIKPMNCPGCCLYFGHSQRSYRQLPLRIAEIGTVYRHELSGALNGLFRVRSFNQDDSHLFMEQAQIEQEVISIIELADLIYKKFNLTWRVELSTKPENYIGTNEMWDFATSALRSALEKKSLDYKINEGDGAFYGPKIDFHIQDAIKRSWQCGTIQLDLNFPERFDLNYIASDNSKKRPTMLHRTIYGSIERFLAVITEHYAGRFPFWLSPNQIKILPLNENLVGYGKSVQHELMSQGFRVAIDDSNESLNKKIRNSQLEQYNYSIILGEKEQQNDSISLRLRSGNNVNNINLADFIKSILIEFKERQAFSQYEKSIDNN